MIIVIKRVTSGRRLLRKKIYKSPHARHKQATFKRENKNLVKDHQKKFKDLNGPIKTKKRPKREVIGGFKMSYRYKYYNNDIVDETEESDDESD